MIDFVHHVFATNAHVTQAIIPLIIGLIAGAVQAASNEQKEQGQRYEKAATERLSPWTGMKAGAIQQANPVGDILQGGFAGLQYGAQNPTVAGPTSDPSTAADMLSAYDGKSAGMGQGALAGSMGGIQDTTPESTPSGPSLSSFDGQGAGGGQGALAGSGLNPLQRGGGRPRFSNFSPWSKLGPRYA